MKTVLLINPGSVNKYCHAPRGWADRRIVGMIGRQFQTRFGIPMHARCATMPPITLYALRALFEKRCRTIVIDEQVESIDLDISADLVCLTATTTQYNRAEEISAEYRRRGILTAIGGIHATCQPTHCASSFDAVCVGEAEAYIEGLIDDLEMGRLKRTYVSESPVPMDGCPFYDYDLASGKHLPFFAINFSRGCVFNCEFCSVRSTVGKHRTRSVASVVERIRMSGARSVWFSDAALTANRAKATELFEALIPLKIKWLASVPLDIAQDDRMLDLMAGSGCWLVSVGFETLRPSNLRASGKKQNRVDEYARTIEAFHKRAIAIEGNFVFGFDDDTHDVFEETARFTCDTGIDLPEFYVLTPYPGTPLYDRLLAEGRIVDQDWSHYDNAHFVHLPVFEPRNLSREELREGCLSADRIAYSRLNTIRRLRNSGLRYMTILLANFIFARRIRNAGKLAPSITHT